MRIAWVVGSEMSKNLMTNLSQNQKTSGGWVYTQLQYFEKEKLIDSITVVSVNDIYSDDSSFSVGKTTVYLIKDKPIRLSVSKKTFQKIDKIMILEKVDIIDVQGTETTLSSYSSYCRLNVPSINTIHGIAFQCYRFYSEGLPTGFLIFGRSIHDYLTMHGILESKMLMKRRANLENHTLQSISCVRGRTNWDRESVLSINPQLRYFRTELIMREPFYNHTWNLDNSIPNRIFVPQMKTPYKGMLILLDALSLVKKVIPDLIVHVPGDYVRKGFIQNGYERYIWKQIKSVV
jgi:hypothetical protein